MTSRLVALHLWWCSSSLQTKWFANWLRSGSFDSQDCWLALELPKDWMSLNGLKSRTFEYRCLSIERLWLFISGVAWRTCVVKVHVLPFIHWQSLEKSWSLQLWRGHLMLILSEDAVFLIGFMADLLWHLFVGAAFIDMASSWSCASLSWFWTVDRIPI